MWFLVSVVAFAAAQTAPSLPLQFVARLLQVNSPHLPPFESKFPSPPFTANRMHSFYDWKRLQMRESYSDFCVPIFQNGSNWGCDFLNVGGSSFLLQHADRFANQPECCVFLSPWTPPNPRFAQQAPFLKTTTLEGRLVDWYQMNVR
jgi:hypothetical protein